MRCDGLLAQVGEAARHLYFVCRALGVYNTHARARSLDDALFIPPRAIARSREIYTRDDDDDDDA